MTTGTFRGGVEVGTILYVAFDDELYTVKSDGELKLFGDLPGSDKIFISRNQNTTPNIVIVCDAGAFEISGGAIIAYSDSDVGTGDNAPNCMTYHDGYFMFGYPNGDIFASGLNAVTINTLDAANAASNADGLVQLWSYSGQLYAGGEKTIEIWGYPVNAAGFPLTRVGYHITPGLIAQHCVAGFEPEFGHPPIYVGTDNTVRWIQQGYRSERISTPDLERLIADVADKTELEAMAYRVAGNAFWQLSCDDWTWVFNCNSPGWFERQSLGQDRSRIAGAAVYAFGKWLVGDTQSSTLLEITDDVQTEVFDVIPATIISPSVNSFPNRVRCARADFNFVVPAVSAGSSAPVIAVSWSDDGGATFSSPYSRSLGNSTSDTIRRVSVFNTGYAKPIGRRWKLYNEQDCNFALLGGDMEPEVRNK
jgi:hypothetical protein